MMARLLGALSGRLLDQPGDVARPPPPRGRIGSLSPTRCRSGRSPPAHLEEREHDATGLGLQVQHRRQQRLVLSTNSSPSRTANDTRRHATPRTNRVAQPEWLALPARVDLRQLGRSAHRGQPLEVSLGLQPGFKVWLAVEVVHHARLAATGHNRTSLMPGRGRFLDDVLQHRTVNDRQQLLGHGLGGGQESRGEASGGDHGLDSTHRAASDMQRGYRPEPASALVAARRAANNVPGRVAADRRPAESVPSGGLGGVYRLVSRARSACAALSVPGKTATPTDTVTGTGRSPDPIGRVIGVARSAAQSRSATAVPPTSSVSGAARRTPRRPDGTRIDLADPHLMRWANSASTASPAR